MDAISVPNRSCGVVVLWSAALDGGVLSFPARRLPGHGLAAEDIVKQRGYEGLVAKMSSSPRIGRGGRRAHGSRSKSGTDGKRFRKGDRRLKRRWQPPTRA